MAFQVTNKDINDALAGTAFAQSSRNISLPLNKTQEWISQKDNVKILFTYQPERPIIDTFTKLQFRVINTTSDEELKGFEARVVVTNGQRLFRFENITVPNGNFSVEYIFPDDGTHQVLTRIDKGTAAQTLASFNVFVPHQAPPSLLNPIPNTTSEELTSITRIVVIVVSFSVIGVVILILKRGRSKRRKDENSRPPLK
jgi:hypothetical protein